MRLEDRPKRAVPGFEDVIGSEAQLREVIAAPKAQAVWDKTIAQIDEHCAAFIARSPFVMIASCDPDGRMDISPKGDPPGFVRVLDEKTLAIPDRPGNGRLDTFRNLVANPRVGLYFLVPGKQETLRVSGSAQVVRDRWLLDELACKGKPAQLALVVHVEEAFFHCAKCVVRSHLWDESEWPDLAGLAPMGKVMVDQAKLNVPAELVEHSLQRDVAERLY